MKPSPVFELSPHELAPEADGGAVVTVAGGGSWRLSPESRWLLEELRAGRDLRGVADRLTARLGRPVDEAAARTLVLSTLGEAGLLRAAGAGAERPGPPRPALRRWTLLPRTTVAALAGALRPLATRPAGEGIALAAAAGVGALLARGGVGDAIAWRSGPAWLAALLLSALSYLAHELGHAAALAAAGAQPGAITFGLGRHGFDFRVDVRGAGSLPRRARLRLDLAGVVAQAAFVTACVGAAIGFGAPVPAPVWSVPLLAAARQLLPTPGSDGDWWLADLAGTRAPGAFLRPPAAAGPRVRAAILAHGWLGAAVALAVTAWAMRLAGESLLAAQRGAGAGATLVALGGAVVAASTATTAVLLVARAFRAPAAAAAIRSAVPWARAVRNLALLVRTRAALALGRGPIAAALPLLANTLADPFPHWSGRERARLVRRYWLADALTRADHHELERGGAADEIRHPEPVRALVAARQGAVVCALHLGPYFYPAQSLVALGARVVAFSAAHVRAQRGGQWESARRHTGGEFETVLAGEAAGVLRARRALREGRLVFLLVDGQNAAGGGDAHRAAVRLAGRELWVRTAAAELAQRAGVPLLCAAAWREGIARRVVEFSPLMPPGEAASAAATTQALFRWFEPFTLAHPEQYEGWVLPFMHWRETAPAPVTTRAELDAATAKARAAIESPLGRARLVCDPTRVGWIELEGERLIVHGERRRVLAGDPLACALLDEARRTRRVHELPRRVRASSDVVATMVARLELAGLVRIEHLPGRRGHG